jgi:hypothetical protein
MEAQTNLKRLSVMSTHIPVPIQNVLLVTSITAGLKFGLTEGKLDQTSA